MIDERVPSTASVLRIRYAMTIAVRFISAVFLVVGFAIAATGLLTFLGSAVSLSGDLNDLARVGGPVLLGTFAAALAAASPGLLLLGLQRRLVRWLAPLPAVGCANCGYPVSPLISRCPECGIAWERPGPAPARPAAPRRAAP